jgi:hypothetical protein
MPRTRPSGPGESRAGKPSPKQDLRILGGTEPEGRAPDETFGSQEGHSHKSEVGQSAIAEKRPLEGPRHNGGRRSRRRAAAKRFGGGGPDQRCGLGSKRCPTEAKPTGRQTKGKGFVPNQRSGARTDQKDRSRTPNPVDRGESREANTCGRAPNETFGSRREQSRKAEPQTGSSDSGRDGAGRPSPRRDLGPGKDEAGRPSPERDLRVPGRTKPEGRAPSETFGLCQGQSRKAEPRTGSSDPGRDEAGRSSSERNPRAPGGSRLEGEGVSDARFADTKPNQGAGRDPRDTQPK